MFENIQLAFQGVFGHKLRSFLTMLGIIIGIASIITIISTIKGTNEQIKQNLIGSGSNIVNVQLYQNDWAVDMSYQTPDGIRVLQDEQRDEMIALDGVADVTLYRSRENVEGFYYRNTGFSGKLYGVDDHYFSVYGYEVRSGRGFTARDLPRPVRTSSSMRRRPRRSSARTIPSVRSWRSPASRSRSSAW